MTENQDVEFESEPIDESPTSAKNLPEFTVRHRNMNAGCWTKELSTKEGELFTAYEVKLDRSYRDKNDEWQHSQALHIRGESDAINLMVTLGETLARIREHKKSSSNDQ
ncbi:MAG: hypothetical protein AAF497_07840 [Planctomycetota bacterium]